MASTDEQQQRVPLAEAWLLATGQEPPVLSEQEIAEIDAKRDAARELRRRIYGDPAASAA
jgi:hypothetical protein